MSDSWPGGYKFDPQLRRLFFPLTSAEACEKSSRWLCKEKLLVLVWESQETHVRHRPAWFDLSFVALNPNTTNQLPGFYLPFLGGSVVSMSDSWSGGYEFETRLRRNFFSAYFRLSPLLKHVKKVVGGFGKKFVLVLVWESQETHVRHRQSYDDRSCSSGVKPHTTNNYLRSLYSRL